jgi:hypothetical protein
MAYDRSRFVRAMLFRRRAIYRPGEMVYIKGIVRQGWLNDLRLASGHRFRPHQGRGDGERELATGDRSRHRRPPHRVWHGYDSFRIARGGSLGEYMAVHRMWFVSGHWQTVTRRASGWPSTARRRFSVTLALDSGITYLGDTISAQTSARYYFDAPWREQSSGGAPVTSEREEALVVSRACLTAS